MRFERVEARKSRALPAEAYMSDFRDLCQRGRPPSERWIDKQGRPDDREDSGGKANI